MKRSKTITLTLLTGVTLFVSGCSDENFKKDAKFFKDKAACQQELNDEKTCAEVEQQAIKQHAETAPKFANIKECEDKFGAGNCGVAPNAQIGQTGQQTPVNQASGSSFMPLMMGYMMGKMMSGGGLFGGGGGLFGGGQQRGYQTEPLYRDKKDTVYNRGGATAGGWNRSTGAFSPSTDFKSKMNPAPMRSGGFGNSSHMSASS